MSNTSTQSLSYAKRLKRMIQLCKSLHPLLARIPSSLPRPGTPSLWTPKLGDAKKDAARKQEYGERDAKRLDSSTPVYFLTRSTDDSPRRTRG